MAETTETPSLPETAGEARRMTPGSMGLCGDLPRIDRDDVITVEHAGRNWTGTLTEALEIGAIRRG